MLSPRPLASSSGQDSLPARILNDDTDDHRLSYKLLYFASMPCAFLRMSLDMGLYRQLRSDQRKDEKCEGVVSRATLRRRRPPRDVCYINNGSSEPRKYQRRWDRHSITLMGDTVILEGDQQILDARQLTIIRKTRHACVSYKTREWDFSVRSRRNVL